MSLILSVDAVLGRVGGVTVTSLSVDGEGDWVDWVLPSDACGICGWLLLGC